MTARRTLLTGGAAALVVLAAGCNGDPSSGPVATTGTVEVTTTDAATETATETVTDDATTTDAATDTATETVTATDDADAPAEPVPAGATEPVESPATGQVFLTDARIGAHEGFDRVVWEYAGDGTPGWRVGYTDDPRRQGSGHVVDLPGDATLEVLLLGVGYPMDGPAGFEPYEGPQRLASADTTVVTEVEVGGSFEAQQDGFVGVTSERPFRVTLLEDPTRVVLDVAH